MKLLSILVLCCLAGAVPLRAAEPMSALIVGGGPQPASNAAQIEGHTKFVASLLPEGTKRTLLFADGKAENKTVAFGDTTSLGEARRALRVLLPDGPLNFDLPLRAPEVGLPIDGPSARGGVRRALTSYLPHLSAHAEQPLLLYFAGHGSSTGEGEKMESTYAFWKDERMGVRELAPQIARLPAGLPVVLVMAQCYSGGFGDLLFHDGSPKSGLIPQNLVGFFSARRDRMASGCGWETEQVDYQDFSSHFFAALAGHGQFGQATPGGDFDGDGQVSLHEAFCYTLIHDDSADTPVCTSEIYLRKTVDLPPRKVYETPYSQAIAEATVAQKTVLETLSERLGVQGEARALQVHDRLTFRDPLAPLAKITKSSEADDRLCQLCERVRGEYFQKWPGLRWPGEKDFEPAVAEAVKALAEDEPARRELLAAKKAADQADEKVDDEEAFLIRFADVYISLVEAATLRAHGKEAAKEQYARLWKAEQQTLPLRREGKE